MECGIVSPGSVWASNKVAGTPYQVNSSAHQLTPSTAAPPPQAPLGLFIFLEKGNLHVSLFAFFGPKQTILKCPEELANREGCLPWGKEKSPYI